MSNLATYERTPAIARRGADAPATVAAPRRAPIARLAGGLAGLAGMTVAAAILAGFVLCRWLGRRMPGLGG